MAQRRGTWAVLTQQMPLNLHCSMPMPTYASTRWNLKSVAIAWLRLPTEGEKSLTGVFIPERGSSEEMTTPASRDTLSDWKKVTRRDRLWTALDIG